ncbi:hypothetical protein HYPDE_41413 [Hyphomicrobium denitrificans 1NES1]|uniref:Uncharacterized protein n=1 Tax=Hyphomicrobium denitrificans 1NES1 TaxID=670307 RepID=N0BHP0_9HYPH|nr:hypothetical protein HYPDE_41413 [Hyphomicrobium denitrificans 1NES1]
MCIGAAGTIATTVTAGGGTAVAFAAGGKLFRVRRRSARRTSFSAPQRRQPGAILNRHNALAMSKKGAFD